jgi:DNA-binding NtrC family response regulator
VAIRTVWFRNFQSGASLEEELRATMSAAGFRIVTDSAAPYGILIFDVVTEDLLSVLHGIRRDGQTRALAICASPRSSETAVVWRLLHAGAADVIFASGGDSARQVVARIERWAEVDDLAVKTTSEESLIGESPAWRALVKRIVEAARFSAIPILLTGQSGTGKELLARLVSSVCAGGGQKFRKELVTVDCGSLVPELSGSEFFGHERGAFTGAHIQREGAFAMADGATLLLDEIGEVPLSLQIQLLRAIQEKTYKRVGGNIWQRTNFRLVCATNRNLEDLVRRGLFRQDLYYRIAGCVFQTPALADRKSDVLPLARHFLRGAFPEGPPDFDSAVTEYLVNREYQGNIRELRQLVDRIAHRHTGPGPITAGDIPEEDRPCEGGIPAGWPDEDFERSISNAIATGASLKEITQTAADTAIRIAVQSEGRNLQRAAGRLGITDRALQMRRASGKIPEQAS